MRRILLIAALLLGACGTKTAPYAAEHFTIAVPTDWAIAEPPMKDISVPPETKLALLKKDARGGNVVITITEKLLQPEEEARFVEASLAVVKTNRAYQEESAETVTINGVDTQLLRFVAQPADRSVVEHFALLPVSANGFGYLVLARFPNGIDEATVDEAIAAMQSFAPNAPSTAPVSSN